MVVEWGGAAYDRNWWLYVNSNEMPWVSIAKSRFIIQKWDKIKDYGKVIYNQQCSDVMVLI